MASSKDTFEASTFLVNTFACGTFRGIGVDAALATVTKRFILKGCDDQAFELLGSDSRNTVLKGSDTQNFPLVGDP